MPLYEWRCARCDVTFEVLVAIGAAKRKRPCPHCRRPAARVMSAVRLNLGRLPPPIDAKPAAAKPDVTQLKVPSFARMCWMDNRSAARLAAYKHGRGAEYDDRIAARDEAKKNYGVADKPSSYPHGHSPLADRAVFARRAAAARKSAGNPEPAR